MPRSAGLPRNDKQANGQGDAPLELVRNAEASAFALPAAELKALRAAHPRALGASRQIARFLCGITSPALSAAKLTRHPRFGSAVDVPFDRMMAETERVLDLPAESP